MDIFFGGVLGLIGIPMLIVIAWQIRADARRARREAAQREVEQIERDRGYRWRVPGE